MGIYNVSSLLGKWKPVPKDTKEVNPAGEECIGVAPGAHSRPSNAAAAAEPDENTGSSEQDMDSSICPQSSATVLDAPRRQAFRRAERSKRTPTMSLAAYIRQTLGAARNAPAPPPRAPIAR